MRSLIFLSLFELESFPSNSASGQITHTKQITKNWNNYCKVTKKKCQFIFSMTFSLALPSQLLIKAPYWGQQVRHWGKYTACRSHARRAMIDTLPAMVNIWKYFAFCFTEIHFYIPSRLSFVLSSSPSRFMSCAR